MERKQGSISTLSQCQRSLSKCNTNLTYTQSQEKKVLTAILNFIKLLLINRRTRLKFGNFLSKTINVINGIGQGDPLLMLLYILYNTNLLKIPINTAKEDAIDYVDNTTFLAIVENFEKMTWILKKIMTREEGGLQWSNAYNSRFEVYKSAMTHYSRKTILDNWLQQQMNTMSQTGSNTRQPDSTRSQQLQVLRHSNQLST